MTRTTEDSRGRLVAIMLMGLLGPFIFLSAPIISPQIIAQWHVLPHQVGLTFLVEVGGTLIAVLPAYRSVRHGNWHTLARAGIGIYVVANLISVVTPTFPALLAARFLSGIGGGLLSTLCICIAATTARPSRAFGLWSLAQGISSGMALLGLPYLFRLYGLGSLYAVLAILAAILLFLVRFIPARYAAPPALEGAKRAMAGRSATIGLLILAAFYLGLSGLWAFVGIYGEGLGLKPEQVGLLMAISDLLGMVGISCSIFMGDSRHIHLFRNAVFAIMAGALLLLYFKIFALGSFTARFAWGFLTPTLMTLLARSDPTSLRAPILSNAVIGLAASIGPVIAGYLFEQHGAFVTVIVEAAGFMLLAAVASAFVGRSSQGTGSQSAPTAPGYIPD